MKLFTIGFTKTSAEGFFARLSKAGVRALVDVRLNNVSQISGFAKRDDLRYFVRALCGISYVHRPELAPTAEMLGAYRAEKDGWKPYVDKFLTLMARRKIEDVDRAALDGGCLLCSEDKPHHCHRRLVAEYLQEKWGGVEIEHL